MLKESIPENSEIKSFANVSIRRDIYEFIKFIKDKPINLTKRDNQIPLPISRKLSQRMSFREDISKLERWEEPRWLSFIYKLCKGLNLVNKDVDEWVDNITGHYFRKNYRPSYPEFDIHLMESNWKKYLETTPVEKERKILNTLCAGTASEFYYQPVYESDRDSDLRFSAFGCGANAQKHVKYPSLRKGLFKITGSIEEGKWYKFNSLLKYIKENYPNLILDHKKRDSNIRENFYDSFYEGRQEQEINEKDTDAFERVEGRYLAYFLETIPFMTNIVELAYSKPSSKILPPRGHVTHFRLTPHGKEILSDSFKLDTPSRIKILPTFEIFIPLEEFEERTLSRLENYAKLLSKDKVYHFKIDKKLVLSELEKGDEIDDIIKFFENLAHGELPQNITYELASYGTHSEKIVRLSGISILELVDPQSANIIEANYSDYIISKVGNTHFLIKEFDKLYKTLMADGRLPKTIDCNRTKKILEKSPQKQEPVIKPVKPELSVGVKIESVYLVYSQDEKIMESITGFLQDEKLEHYLSEERIIVREKEMRLIMKRMVSVGVEII